MNLPKNLSKPDAIFFDWDGTLVDSYSFLNDAHSHVLTSFGFEPFKDDEFKLYFGKPREILYRQIYKDHFEEAKIRFEKYVFENNHKIQFLEGADNLLEALHQKQYLMGVVSNKKGSFILREIENFGWQKYFTSIVGAGEASEDKPSSAPLKMATERADIDLKTHHVWYVGDTETDLKCAKEAGCPAIFMDGHDNAEKWIKEHQPALVIKECRELQEILVAL